MESLNLAQVQQVPLVDRRTKVEIGTTVQLFQRHGRSEYCRWLNIFNDGRVEETIYYLRYHGVSPRADTYNWIEGIREYYFSQNRPRSRRVKT
jgi:hypothetical protein